MLGIIIGIASIITIVSTIKGTNEQIKESLVGAGNNAVVVQLYQDNYPYEVQYNGVPAGVYPITEETRQELCKIDHVKGVSLFCSRNYADGVYYGNNSFSGNLYGIDEYYFDVNGYSLDHGRSFLKEDFAKAKKVCMLDTAAASALFSGEDPVGKTVEMQGDSFTVVGVVKRARSTTMQIKTPSDYYQYMNETGTIFLPLKTWPMLYSFDEPQCAALRADNTDNMTSVGQKAGELLSSSQLIGADKTLSYRGQDLMEQAKNLQELSNSSNRQLIWIASISLLVGGIGGVLALRDLTGVLVHRRTVGCRAGADCRIVGCLGLVAGGSNLVVGAGDLIVGCLGGVFLRLRLVDRLLQVRDGLCGGFRAGTGCRAGMGSDWRHHGGVLRAPVTGLGECRER